MNDEPLSPQDEESSLDAELSQEEEQFLQFLVTAENAIEADGLTAELVREAAERFGQTGIDALRSLKWLNDIGPSSEIVTGWLRSDPLSPVRRSVRPVSADLTSDKRDTFVRSNSLIRAPAWALARLGKHQQGVIAGAVVVAAALLLVLPVQRAKAKLATLVVEVNEDAAVVEVLNEQDGVEITRPCDNGRISITIDPGKHRLKVVKDGFEFFAKDFEIESGGRKTITAKLIPVEGERDAPQLSAGPPKLTIDPRWIEQVKGLPAAERVESVVAKLKELNPGFDGKVKAKIENGEVTELQFLTDEIAEISPVQALPGLRKLDCSSTLHKGRLTDLDSLQALKSLAHLNCNNTLVADLSPLKGMRQLRELWIDGTHVLNLSPIQKLPLTDFHCSRTGVSDLTPLRQMRLTTLQCYNTQVSNLSPLKRMRLTNLAINNTQVFDLSPLRGMQLSVLYCGRTQVKDLAPLEGMPLTNLACEHTAISDLTPLKSMPLTIVNCMNTQVRDLSPLSAAPLTILACQGTQVSDLTPLKGKRITVLDCSNTLVTDLSPLQDSPLSQFVCNQTQVTDYSPLRGKPLKKIVLDYKPDRDSELLRSLTTLEVINGKPAAIFWKEATAQP